MSKLISVTPKFQVTIPKEIRAKLSSFKPFSKVEVTYDEENDSIMIKPTKDIKIFKNALGKPPTNAGLEVDEFTSLVGEAKAEYYSKKYGKSN